MSDGKIKTDTMLVLEEGDNYNARIVETTWRMAIEHAEKIFMLLGDRSATVTLGQVLEVFSLMKTKAPTVHTMDYDPRKN